jgi:hypothetical protein
MKQTALPLTEELQLAVSSYYNVRCQYHLNGSKVCLIDNDGFICRIQYVIFKIKSWKIKESDNYRSYSRKRAFVYTVGTRKNLPINGKYEDYYFQIEEIENH